MKPPHDRVLLPDKPQGPVLHVRREARREPHPWRLLRHALQKVAEPLATLPPGIYRLSQERHVPRAGDDQTSDLLHHVHHRPTHHPAPDGWHHAVAALVVAAGHYGDERRVPAFCSRKLRRACFLHPW